MRKLLMSVVVMMFLPAAVYAGWLGEALKGAAEGLGHRAVDEASESAYEGAKEGIKGMVKKGNSRDDYSDGGEDAPPKSAQSSPSNSVSSDSGGDIGQLEGIYSKYDFIPGDKVIFFDDFSETDIGEFPRKWTPKGPGIDSSNTVEVVSFQGRNFLRSAPSGGRDEDQEPARQYIRLAKIKDMPRKFTVEFDAVQGYGAQNEPIKYTLLLVNEDSEIGWSHVGNIMASGEEGRSANTATRINKTDGKIHRISVSVDGTFVKAYVDNERVVNDPDGVIRPITNIGLIMDAHYNHSPNIMFTDFRVAEGGKEIKSALDTDGRIVTHGILFDINSDRLKPESLPTLKMLLGLLQDDPSLKFSIEGHTDNQGGPAINKPLSEKRAQAVKAWLEGKDIAPDRLTARGWGQEKPMDKNDTPEGRANNRRVEFVKIR